jgi:outer membrane protein assembly factor BamB
MRRAGIAVCVLFFAALILFPKTHLVLAQLATAPWPVFHQNLAHTGLSQSDTSGNPGVLKWDFATNSLGGIEADSGPTIGADGTIYFGSMDGNFYAVNPDGSQKWVFPLGSVGAYVRSSAAIGADGTLYFGTTDQDTAFYAVNPDGTLKWEYVFPMLPQFYCEADDLSSPAIGTDGTIYFGVLEYCPLSSGGTLYAFNPDGTPKWTVLGAGGDSSPAIGSDGTIYVGSDSNVFYAVNPNGTLKWTFRTGDIIRSSPAIGGDGTIYVGSFDHKLYAINPDGTEKWTFATADIVGSSPAIGADGTIYVGSVDHNLYAVNPDGTEKWAFATGNRVTSSPAIGSDGLIYIGSLDGNLYALNPDGTQKWALAVGPIYTSSPAITADGDIVIYGSPDSPVGAIGVITKTGHASGASLFAPASTSSSHLVAVGPPCPTCPTATPTATPMPTPTTTLTITGSLAFGNVAVGQTVAKNVTIHNTGTANSLVVSSAISSNSEYALTGTGTCSAIPITLAPAATCTFGVAFTPAATGPHASRLTISDNATTSPQIVVLGGTGTITMTVTPASYGFGSVKDGTKVTKAILVHNYQTQSVTLSEGFSGPNAGDFSVTGGTCTSALPKASICTLIVTFAPTATGTESATMKVTDGPDPLGPYTVSFTASAFGGESVSAAKLAFGNVYQAASKTLSITLTNKATTGSITLTGAIIGGSGDFAVTGGSCGGSLAASSSCTYAVTFAPGTETAETGTLSIGVVEDPNGGPPAVGLSGTGVTPIKALPASIAFGTIASGHSSLNKTVTITNSGGATVTLSENVTGANASDFIPVAGGTCGTTLAGAGAHCTYLLKFTPSIVGAESATLGVSAAGDTASPHHVSLNGTGS